MLKELGQIGLAFAFSDTPARVQGPPFLVGADTRAILSDLGYDAERIDALLESKAVGDKTGNPTLAASAAS